MAMKKVVRPLPLCSPLENLECELSTPRQIMVQRMRYLGVAVPESSDGCSCNTTFLGENYCFDSMDCVDAIMAMDGSTSGGLPKQIIIFMKRVFVEWSRSYNSTVLPLILKTSHASESEETPILCGLKQFQILKQTIQLIIKVTKMDPILGEELVHYRTIDGDGSDNDSMISICSRIIEQLNQLLCESTDDHYFPEQDLDALANLQDLVYELKSLTTLSSSFMSSLPTLSSSSRSMPFTDDELRSRLPLVYKFKSVHHSENNPDCGVQLNYNQHHEHGKQTQQLVGVTCGNTCNQSRAIIIYIDQVRKRQSAQVDVGFVMWPSAIVLSRWLMSNPHIITETVKKDEESYATILELGAGCGLVGITAARIIKDTNGKAEEAHEEELCDESGQQRRTQPIVIITDVNDLVLENISRNIALNDVASLASVSTLDFYAQTGCNYLGKWISCARNHNTVIDASSTDVANEDVSRDPVDVILAADFICQPEDAVAASKTIYDALRPGGKAFVVCANAEHRWGVEIFESECEQRGLAVVTTNVAEMYNGELLRSEDMETAAGYIDGMQLTFFEITKIKM